MANSNQEEWTNPLTQALKNILPQSKSSQPSRNEYPDSVKNIYGKNDFSSQSLINVKDIRDGIIHCADGSYVRILEVIPIDFYQKDVIEKNKIGECFSMLFRTCPSVMHIKMRTEYSDATSIIEQIRRTYKREKNPYLKEQSENYIKHIKTLQNGSTIEKKFYIVFAYEGENGKMSRKYDEIRASMYQTEFDIRSKLISCGNIVVSTEDENLHMCEILYKFYNPLTSQEESIKTRINRIANDYEMTTGEEASVADFIAPKGLITYPSRDWLFMDGMYHTWLIIRDNAYPAKVQTGWIDNIPVDIGIDVDIFSKKLNRDVIIAGLKQMRKFKYSVYNKSQTNYDKAESSSREIANTEYIKEALMGNDEDMFNVEIVITVRGETFAEMKSMRAAIKKRLDGLSIYTSTSFLTAFDYLRNVAPDSYFSKTVMNKYAHNFLTRNMGQLYPFTSMSLYDPEGFIIGRNVIGSSIVSFNNFNTQLYSNANIVIMGTPGSGKSFLEMMLAYRMRMMGIRTMFILPLKAHEYYEACEKIGGQYIKFIPGGNACVNIMEIRPQVSADGRLLEDAEDAEAMNVPLLARKISSLCAWLQLNMQEDKLTTSEKNRFSTLCTKLYANYGITANNDSIWINKEKRQLKTMPILQDLNDALQEDSTLSRIKDVLSPYMHGGIFSNFNGPTNVNLNNPFLVFDVDKTSINEDYLPALMYIAFDCCYDLAKQSLRTKDAIFMDEVWLMMQNADCAKQVKEMVKIIRGYGSCTVLATQDIGDFLRSCDGTGEAILAASKLKFFLRCEDMELKHIASVVDLNANDFSNFKKFPPHGRAMLMSDKDKILIDLIASEKEVEIFTTDVNLRNKKGKF